MLIQLVLVSSGLLLVLGIASVVLHPRAVWRAAMYGATASICLVLFAGALWFMVCAQATQSTLLPLGLPWLHAHFALDLLTCAFLVVVSLGGAVTGLYAIGSQRQESAPGRVLPFFPAFLSAMLLVLVAADAFTFLFSWELMSLMSWALVMAHHHDRETAPAGYLYLLMAGIGTGALLLSFGLLAGSGGDYSFAGIRSLDLSPTTSGVVLCLALFGAGSKAGLVPLHAWLPLAHPAAPSHVSALLSGVMTKVAIYGFTRIVFDLLGAPAPWWAILVLVIAGPTAVLGVLYALMQSDLKRMLAYSTVENVGVIFIGLGLALAFESYAMPRAAALAFVATLLHVLNHSMFKSLLFFGAGAVLTATGERSMERLGGLIHRMPATSLTFLAGAAAMSALPPLNGFVSEWLMFQAVLLSPDLPDWGLKLLIPAIGALIALAAAFAAACYVKAFGVSFLGRPRSAAAADATETDGFSIVAMATLAVLCAMAGVFPGFLIDTIAPLTQQLVSGMVPRQSEQPWLTVVPVEHGRSSYNGLLVLAFIVSASILVATFIHRFSTRALRRAPAWDCGYPDAHPATQYTGASFTQPIRRIFGSVLLMARENVAFAQPGSQGAARLVVTLVDPVWAAFYAPLARGVRYVTEWMTPVQLLSIRQYLGIVFIALVGLLVILAVWP